MHIANPMYDAIFKHLLEDTVSARLIIGAILGEEIEALELVPQESAVRVRPREGEEADFTVRKAESLMAEVIRTPYQGTGHPKALKAEFEGYWSRRAPEGARDGLVAGTAELGVEPDPRATLG